MQSILNEKYIISLKKLDNKNRYIHLIKQIADKQEVWTIKMDDGFLLLGDDHGNEYIPLWPYPEFIKDFQVGSWESAVPERIDLDSFLQNWIPGMHKTNRKIAAFPVNGKLDGTISPEEFESDLKRELSKYE